jgi:Chaperone of endosialidase
MNCGKSSLRFKTNVHSFRLGLDIVQRLRPISFNWKAGGRPDIGLGAEDVAQVAPSFVTTNDKGEVEGVKYDRLNILLINAVKEEQNEIEKLRAENTALNSRLRNIERTLRREGLSRRRR